MTTSSNDYSHHSRPDWRAMTPAEFTDRPHAIQGALFAAPDPYGTPDLFTTNDDQPTLDNQH